VGIVPFVQCPECGGRNIRSERTHGFREKCLAIGGFYAFFCQDCCARFLERPIELASVVYAKCPKCLRMDLSAWDAKYYRVGWWTSFRVWLGAHRWRCEPCRVNFVSWRMRREKYVRPDSQRRLAGAE
jgi:hypothetical protein